MRYFSPRLVRYLLFAAALAGAIYSFLYARAAWLFKQDTAVSVPAAVRLVPYASDYLARLASWIPDKKIALLRRAVELNPFDSDSWIQLGFAAEYQQHDKATAERFFLRAAEVNRMFRPKWTLANFYFRQGRTEEFFRWANASLTITPYPPDPIFEQMWAMDADGGRIAAAVPNRPRILLAYACFLSNRDRTGTIPAIVDRLIAAVGNRAPHAWGRDDLLPAIEDRLLAAGDRDAALHLWNTLAKAGWVQQGVPSIARPVTNGDFRRPLFRHGFDWMPAEIDGLHIVTFPSTGMLRIELSGDQPENCVLLRQYLPVKPGSAYTVEWHAAAQLAETPGGIRWHLKSARTGVESEPASADLSVSPIGVWRVRAPLDSDIGVLSLECSRPLGRLRARGAVILRSVSAKLE